MFKPDLEEFMEELAGSMYQVQQQVRAQVSVRLYHQ